MARPQPIRESVQYGPQIRQMARRLTARADYRAAIRKLKTAGVIPPNVSETALLNALLGAEE